MGSREIAQALRAANPWWNAARRASWPDDDEQLTTRARHELVAATRAAERILVDVCGPSRPGDVVLLHGPPGVGKTTAVKDVVVRHLADPSVDRRAVVWVPVAELPDDLERVLAHPTAVGVPVCDGVRLWVLDEVTAAADWQRLIDAVPSASVLATSSVIEPAQLREFGGTHRAGSLRMMRPMSLANLMLAQPGAAPAGVRAAYLVGGGFPRAVAELRDLGAVSGEFVAELLAGLKRGMCPADRAMPTAEVLSAICSTAERDVRVERVAQVLDVPVEVAQGCVDRLAALGVIEPRRGFVDPLLHWLPHLADERYPAPTLAHVAAFSR